MSKLLKLTPKGLYCQQADVYLDPWKPVNKAIISHAHADHARPGSKHYVSHPLSAPIIKHRLGVKSVETKNFSEKFTVNGVSFSFHPAGHIPGSCQIRVEYKGEVWVFTGDYNTLKNDVYTPYEPVKCHTFITESTFGLPVYNWKENTVIAQQINEWWSKNKANGVTSILCGYSLGKAQRIIQSIDKSIGKIYTHAAVENINELYRNEGLKINPTIRVTKDIPKSEMIGELVICPPGSIGASWLNKFKPYKTAICSGWMLLRGAKRRRNVDKGFVMSDHADWNGLNQAVKATGAEKVYVTHGYTEVFSQWLTEKGIDAEPLKTEFEGEIDND